MALSRRAAKLASLLTILCGACLVFVQPALAVWPGENGKIIFWKAPLSQQMSAQIYSMDSDGSHQTNLSAAGGGANQLDIQPSVSPNGKRIAFTRALIFPGPTPAQPLIVGQIFTMRIDGSHQMNISNDAAVASESGPSWTEDGSSILFVKLPRGGFPGFGGSIWIRKANGQGSPEQVTAGPNDANPAMSPDGDLIAFSRPMSDGTRHLMLMKADGSETPRDLGMGAKPDWSPDGTRLVYGQGGFGPIMVVQVSNPSNKQKLADVGNEAPVWSPDGSQIVYLDCTAFPTPCQVAVMNADGSNKHDITSDPSAGHMKPDWQSVNREAGERN